MVTPTPQDSRTSLERLAEERTVLLTTFRKDGTPVPTPVHIVSAGDGDAAYIRTFDPSGKLKRMRRNPDVEIAPATFFGRPTGSAIAATARVLEGDESTEAGRAIATKYPLLQGRLVPWYHRRKGYRTTHLALAPRRQPNKPSDV